MTFTLRSQTFCFFSHITIICHEISQFSVPTPSNLVRGDLYRLGCFVNFDIFMKVLENIKAR